MLSVIAIFTIALLIGGSVVGLGFRADDIDLLDQLARPDIRSVITFTLWQSTLSASISCLLALPLARAIHRQPRFLGRTLLIRLTSVSLVVPTMVAIIGIIGVYGRSGWINDLFEFGGLPRQDYLYGLNGILIAHVFFNLPLVTRLLLNGLSSIPDQQ